MTKLGSLKKYFTVDLFMIASSYFKNAKNYRTVKDQQLTIAAKANIFICIIFVCFGPFILHLQTYGSLFT